MCILVWRQQVIVLNISRDGLDFEQWWYNLVKLHFNDIDNCMMTINALCLAPSPDMIEKILRARDLFDNNFATMSFNILRFPFLSCLVLPTEIKQQCVERLQELDPNKHA